ncbi:endonuclease [Halobacteriales archaeon QS_4_69_31]|nr:MAG: endonuclease [Halobacteriales archaeon QS_4_69_31]
MDADTVRVCTYNVRRDVADDGEYDWAGRRDAVASTLRFHRPDLVGLQEPLAHQYDDLRAALEGYEWVGRSRGAGEREEEFCPLGYRADRFDRLDAGTFWLSSTPDEPGSVGWDASWPRIVTWARLRDRRTGRAVAYLNTHLDHEGPRARREGAGLLVDRLAGVRAGDPAVVAGDFNCTTDGAPYAILAGAGDRESPLTDAREATPHRPHGPTTTRTDYESLVPGRRIDHVFVADCDVEGYGVATDMGGDGWYPSDHLPVVVDLRV